MVEGPETGLCSLPDLSSSWLKNSPVSHLLFGALVAHEAPLRLTCVDLRWCPSDFWWLPAGESRLLAGPEPWLRASTEIRIFNILTFILF